MTKIILHNLTKGTQLMLVALLLSSCFVIDKSLFNGIVTAKNLWVQAVSILAMSFIVVYTFLTKQFQIKQADILLFILCLWMIGRELFSTMPHANSPKYILNILVYVCIYVFCRTVGNSIKTTKVLIVSYLSIVCLQAIIGLLQLYGFLYSHHALFKITGTFHNPSPFSGFIVSGIPLAVALYFGTRKSRQLAVSGRQSNVSNRCSVFSKQFWFDIQLTKILDCVRLLTNSEFWIRLNWNQVLNYFAQFVIVVLLLVLPATKSRAAWLGGIVGYFYVAWQFGLHRKVMQRIANNLKLNLNNSLKKTLVLFTILIFTATIFGMYKFKQGSADGRLLMWQVSWEMIKDKPLLGYGQGGFEANYANYQAEWFRSGKGTEAQEMVAGSPDAPFNELIRVAVNYGAIGVIFVFAMLIILFRKDSQRNTEVHGDSLSNSGLPSRFSLILKGGLISILIFSLFSYPLDVTQILVQIILLVALTTNQPTEYILPNTKHRILNIERNEIPYPLNFNIYGTDYRTLITKITILLIGIIPFAILNLKQQFTGLRHWQEAYRLYQFKVYGDSSKEFNLALECLPKNGQLLQMKGKCLAMDQKYTEAINTMLKAKERISNPIIYTALGDCYGELGEYKKAEDAYIKASYMEPHKFYPQYLLAKLYDKSGKKEKVEKAIQGLLAKEVKISSFAITEMKDELKRLLQK